MPQINGISFELTGETTNAPGIGVLHHAVMTCACPTSDLGKFFGAQLEGLGTIYGVEHHASMSQHPGSRIALLLASNKD